jgi:hypothetical protein
MRACSREVSLPRSLDSETNSRTRRELGRFRRRSTASETASSMRRLSGRRDEPAQKLAPAPLRYSCIPEATQYGLKRPQHQHSALARDEWLNHAADLPNLLQNRFGNSRCLDRDHKCNRGHTCGLGGTGGCRTGVDWATNRSRYEPRAQECLSSPTAVT